jgi:hypothetical protein
VIFVLLALVAELLPLAAHADGQPVGPEQGVCKDRVPAAARCHWITGTVAIYNGTPSIRIRADRGGAMLAIGPSEDEWMPDELKSALHPDQPLHGRMLVCPLPQSQPRGFRRVCVGAVQKLAAAKQQ